MNSNVRKPAEVCDAWTLGGGGSLAPHNSILKRLSMYFDAAIFFMYISMRDFPKYVCYSLPTFVMIIKDNRQINYLRTRSLAPPAYVLPLNFHFPSVLVWVCDGKRLLQLL